MAPLRSLSLAIGLALLSACAVGPDYKRPETDTAANFKELDGWKPSAPGAAMEPGPWWQIFDDEVLSDLERQVEISNQNLKAAAAAFAQARALVAEARAGYWPTISATASRERTSSGAASTRTLNSAGLAGNWTLDIWGQIRRSTESARASAQASDAALAAATLSTQTALASDYFQLRGQDQLQILLNDIVAAEEQSLKITESRYKFGVAALADVVSAKTQLLSSQAQQVNVGIQRAILEHAIAVLIGKQPAKFTLSTATMRGDVPTVPPGLPSALLERRPDVAEAERHVAAAGAQIGVARAAYFPVVSLGASLDYASTAYAALLQTSNRVWAFGPALALSLFDGGLRHAQVAAARAVFDENVADYRQTVLMSFEQVEDQLVTLRVLEKQSAIEDQVVKEALEAERLTLNQYKAGTVPYSSVITAQTTRLSNEENALTVLVDRLTASVNLIDALGGGWNTSKLQ